MMVNEKSIPEFKNICCLIIGSVFFMTLFFGCGLPKKQALTVHYYTLSYDLAHNLSNGLTDDLANDAPKTLKTNPTAVIDVKPVTVQPPYNTRRIVYTDDTGLEQAFYRYHMWTANPADIVFNLIAKDLRQSGVAAAVLTGPSEIVASHTIEIVINKFYEKDQNESWQAILSMTLRLIQEHPAGPGTLVFEKTYADQKMLEHKNPAGLARAMSQALAGISVRMLKDISMHLDTEKLQKTKSH